MSQFVIKELDKKTKEYVRLHFVSPKQPGEPGFYREAISWSAFAHWFPKNFLKTRHCPRRHNKDKMLLHGATNLKVFVIFTKTFQKSIINQFKTSMIMLDMIEN